MNTWAEYCVVEGASLIPVKKELPFELSGQLALNTLTAMALLQESKIKAGDFLLLNAASYSLGSMIIQLALARKYRVIALIRDARHQGDVKALGAEAVFLQDFAGIAEKIRQLTEGRGINAFLDAVGGPTVTPLIPVMAPFGHIMVYGNFSGGASAT